MRVAEKAFERAKALSVEGAIGISEYQRREAEHENARAELYEAEEKLHLLGMAEREIERLSAEQLPHAEVAQVFCGHPSPVKSSNGMRRLVRWSTRVRRSSRWRISPRCGSGRTFLNSKSGN